MMGGNDALSRRIERRVENGGTQSKTRFIHDGVRVAEEWDIPAIGSPTLEASYVYGNYVDEVLTMRRGGEDYYYHGDDMHNVVKLTDGDGLVVEGYDYGDYGAPEFYDEDGALTSATASAFGNPYLFSGREWEEELGLYHFRNRYMDPALGRFTSRDPLGLWGDAANLGNGYTYCAGNPWSMVDPFGLASGGNQSAQQNAGVVDQIMGVIQNNWWDFLVGFVIDGAGGGIQAVWQLFRHPIQTWDALKATVTALVNDPGGFFGDIRDQMLASLTDPRALGALTFDALVTVTGVGAAYMGLSRVGKGLKLLKKLGGGRRDRPDIGKGKAVPGPGGPKCFIAGTLVLAASGLIPIENIAAGDLVYAYCEDSKEVVEREVIQTFKSFTYYWVDIDVGEETITATRLHRFWVESEKKWVEALELGEGMQLRLASGELRQIKSVALRELEVPQDTFNLEVELDHNYFVGCSSALVHNGYDGYGPSPTPPGPPPVPVPGATEGTEWVPKGPQRNGVPSWQPNPSLPTPTGSQPRASWDPSGHWDIDDGLGGRERYDFRGNRVTPDEAHGRNRPRTPGQNMGC